VIALRIHSKSGKIGVLQANDGVQVLLKRRMAKIADIVDGIALAWVSMLVIALGVVFAAAVYFALKKYRQEMRERELDRQTAKILLKLQDAEDGSYEKILAEAELHRHMQERGFSRD
jgi:cell division protein FtsN